MNGKTHDFRIPQVVETSRWGSMMRDESGGLTMVIFTILKKSSLLMDNFGEET